MRVFFLSSVILLATCSPRHENSATVGKSEVKHARRFKIDEQQNHRVISIYGDRTGKRITSTYVLADDTSGLGSVYPGVQIIKTPCTNVAALSSIYAAMICEVGGINSLTAIDNIDYINNLQVLEKHKNGGLRELAKTPDIDLEQTLRLKPDIVFTFGMGYNTEEDKSTLRKSAIPIAVSVDHLEESPLGRAEWIKFFASFINKSRQADSIFTLVENNYQKNIERAKKYAHHPTVFSEVKFGEVWYMPGGKSFMATLLRDAGADYLWKENNEVGSLPLSFEQVYAKARDADFWLNLPMVKSKSELLAYDERYADFKAFKADHVYNNTRIKNRLGYSNYWETGMIYPDRILNDLVTIFHEPENEGSLYYYEKLK